MSSKAKCVVWDQPCGGRLNSKDAGYITSPGYPQDYPSHQNCEWIVYAPEPNQKIVLNFNPHFEIEKHDCKYDFIEIRDGDSESADLLGKHCGNIAPPTIISSGSMLYIKFTSDYARQGAGFSLRYEIFKTGSEDCSKNFTSPNGTIESPGFPEKYPHNLDCTFTILAKPKMEIILQFLTFDLEHDPLQVGEGDCKYDWLDIWDGIPHVGPLIGKYCGTKTPSELRSSTGILSLTFHTDMAVAKDGFSARYYLVHQEPLETFQCNAPLGMESGRIANEQISASSTYSDGRWTPQQSRLHGDDNGWTPNLDSSKEYLQVDLRFLTMLTAIATQGAISRETQNGYYVKTYKLEVSTNGEDWMVYRHGKNHKVDLRFLTMLTAIATQGAISRETQNGYYVKTYKLEVSTNGEDWMVYRHGKNHKVFQANNDATEVVLNKLHTPLLTRFVRIRPQTWHSGIALRLELFGCRVTDAPCSNMLGMLSGLIADSQISASSTREYLWSPSTARLVSSRSGWFPRIPQAQPGEEWLQVDLGAPKTVKGVIIQGARGGDSITAVEARAFVRKFKVSYSLNGKDWEYIQDPRTQQPKLFEGNMHYDTPDIRRFDPVPAQYVRVYPERWSPAGIGMRLEVLGCDWTGSLLWSLECEFASAMALSVACDNPHFNSDSKPTVETLGPTVKSEETTTPYPIDEEATECGENCSFEDDSKPTVETLGPTVKSEETTTPYPIDEEATECGENCSFEDDKDLQLPSGFNCNFDFPEEPCGWMYDHAKWLRSTWTSSSSPNDQTFPDDRNFLRLQSDGRREGQYARLISPPVHLPGSPVCMEFQYQATGGRGVALQVVREASQESKLLWVIREDQGGEWKLGRIILPSYDMEYQIVFEGVIGKGRTGEIAIDDIRISTDVPLENCMEPISAFAEPISAFAGGTLLPGTEPTVDTVPVQPIPAYWYYVMAAGGAVLVLVSVALALVLHYHRFRYAAKKTDHSITYKTSHYTNGAPLAVEPTLTIKLEQDRGSHC
ncbi:Neuropilin-2 [Tupaia chinensis]|uniref:Neuropilin-2 n=1 Tax=Tupaia chinensis TaxID=246437 RepID=L9LAN7_TUPCH|nr:Neuropilin-2 [Tupaia chinensis]